LQLRDYLREDLKIDLLLSIAQCFRRKRVNLDQKSVGTDRDSASAQHWNQISPATSLAWIDYNRQMGFLLGHRNCRQIQRIAGIGFECPYTAFA
jgi:hypothetical protein